MNDTFQSAGAVASKVVNRWEWWQNALKGKFGPIHDGTPNQGYFRVRRKDGPWEPVAIWQEYDGSWLAYRQGKEVRAEDIWTWVCRNPISFEAYEKAMAGGGFDDEPKQATIGDNSGDADPFEALRIEFDGEAELAREFLKAEVKTQADADKAGIWSKRLGDISKRADGEREREKAPHLTASRAVDDKWRPLVGDAKDMATSLKRHVEPFLIAQKRAEEARAKAAADEAARLRREAEAVAREEQQRAEEGNPDGSLLKEADRLREQAKEAEKAAEVQNATAGRTGARVALRTDKRAKIVDFDACLAALKDRPELIELVQSLANRAVKSGFTLAGVEVELVEKVA